MPEETKSPFEGISDDDLAAEVEKRTKAKTSKKIRVREFDIDEDVFDRIFGGGNGGKESEGEGAKRKGYFG